MSEAGKTLILRCEWCDRPWWRRAGPGRVPQFCKGKCRTASCRAHAIAKELEAAAVGAGATFLKLARIEAIGERVQADERAARAMKRR